MAGRRRARVSGGALMHPGCRIEQVYLCRDPVDFRKSIGGLSVLVEQELELDPFGSALYVFINRQRNKIKVLYWHRNGFCLWLKRLEADKFAWPQGTEAATQTINLQQFEWLLEGFDLWRNSPHKTLHFASVS
jgi:transposase